MKKYFKLLYLLCNFFFIIPLLANENMEQQCRNACKNTYFAVKKFLKLKEYSEEQLQEMLESIKKASLSIAQLQKAGKETEQLILLFNESIKSLTDSLENRSELDKLKSIVELQTKESSLGDEKGKTSQIQAQLNSISKSSSSQEVVTLALKLSNALQSFIAVLNISPAGENQELLNSLNQVQLEGDNITDIMNSIASALNDAAKVLIGKISSAGPDTKKAQLIFLKTKIEKNIEEIIEKNTTTNLENTVLKEVFVQLDAIKKSNNKKEFKQKAEIFSAAFKELVNLLNKDNITEEEIKEIVPSIQSDNITEQLNKIAEALKKATELLRRKIKNAPKGTKRVIVLSQIKIEHALDKAILISHEETDDYLFSKKIDINIPFINAIENLKEEQGISGLIAKGIAAHIEFQTASYNAGLTRTLEKTKALLDIIQEIQKAQEGILPREMISLLMIRGMQHPLDDLIKKIANLINISIYSQEAKKLPNREEIAGKLSSLVKVIFLEEEGDDKKPSNEGTSNGSTTIVTTETPNKLSIVTGRLKALSGELSFQLSKGFSDKVRNVALNLGNTSMLCFGIAANLSIAGLVYFVFPGILLSLVTWTGYSALVGPATSIFNLFLPNILHAIMTYFNSRDAFKNVQTIINQTLGEQDSQKITSTLVSVGTIGYSAYQVKNEFFFFALNILGGTIFYQIIYKLITSITGPIKKSLGVKQGSFMDRAFNYAFFSGFALAIQLLKSNALNAETSLTPQTSKDSDFGVCKATELEVTTPDIPEQNIGVTPAEGFTPAEGISENPDFYTSEVPLFSVIKESIRQKWTYHGPVSQGHTTFHREDTLTYDPNATYIPETITDISSYSDTFSGPDTILHNNYEKGGIGVLLHNYGSQAVLDAISKGTSVASSYVATLSTGSDGDTYASDVKY